METLRRLSNRSPTKPKSLKQLAAHRLPLHVTDWDPPIPDLSNYDADEQVLQNGTWCINGIIGRGPITQLSLDLWDEGHLTLDDIANGGYRKGYVY